MKTTIIVDGIKVEIEEYFAIFENLNIAVCINRGDGEILYVNKETLKMFSYSRDEMIGTSIKNLYANLDDRTPLVKIIKEKGNVKDYPIKLKKKNDEIIDCEFNTNLSKDDNGDIILYGFIRDVSERKKIENQLLKSETEKSIILESTKEIITFYDINFRILWVNKAFADLLGLKNEDIIGRYCFEVRYNRNNPCGDCPVLKVLETRKSQKSELNSSDGKIWDMRAYPIFDTRGNISNIVEIGMDITENKKAEKALKESEEKYRNYIENAPDGVFVADKDGNFVEANEAASKIIGYSNEEILRLNIKDIIPPDIESMKISKEHFEKLINTGRASGVVPHMRKDGNKIYLALDAVKLSENRILGFAKDVTEKIKAEITLRGIMDAAPVGISLTQDRILKWSNKSMSMITGYPLEDLVGKNSRLLYESQEEYERVGSILYGIPREEEIIRVQSKHMLKNGDIRDISILNRPLDSRDTSKGYITIIEDITEKVKADEKIKEREATLRGIMDAAPIGIVFAIGRKIIWASKSAYEMVGYADDTLTGKDTISVYENEEEYKRVGSILYGNIGKIDVPGVIAKVKRKDGSLFDCELRVAPLDKTDLSKGLITIMSDVTTKLKSQKQLDENLEYFAHLVDHIRNPLAIICGFTQVEVENEKTKERILRQIDRIDELINQLDKGWMDTQDTRRFLKKYM